MKTIFKIPTIVIFIILSIIPVTITAENTSATYTVTLQTQPNKGKEHNQPIDQEGQRAPARPIQCYISESTGIDIPAVDKSDITSFEVYSENGICLASLAEESEFISFLFSLSEPVEIRIITDQYIYHGYTSM